MPDRPLTIATYAAGASLAAITLVYVFGPTFIDGGSSDASSSSRKKGAVGLSNPANDCFINSVLQALAGLDDLRDYLVRELHRRKLDGPEVSRLAADSRGKSSADDWKQQALQRAIVTQALKSLLDKLNERPIYKKTISAEAFVAALEHAFRTRLSRQQQDAQEFLQIVAERLSDEYHAGYEARRQARKRRSVSQPHLAKDGGREDDGQGDRQGNEQGDGQGNEQGDGQAEGQGNGVKKETNGVSEAERQHLEAQALPEEKEDGFPFEGLLESQIECLTCHFKPKPKKSTFVTLTLNVPQQSSTSLNACFDGLFKTEYIEDFKCERCRLEHAFQLRSQALAKAKSDTEKASIESEMYKIEKVLREDPERPPKGLVLPDIKYAPRRKIARHTRIISFPKIMAIHLSRSIYDTRSASVKNAAKVAFPERLPLGGILHQKRYKLFGLVMHKGSHNSGHYESFRRQSLSPPSPPPGSSSNLYPHPNPISLSSSSPNSSTSPNPSSTISSPRVSATVPKKERLAISPSPDQSYLLSSSSASTSSADVSSARPSSDSSPAHLGKHISLPPLSMEPSSAHTKSTPTTSDPTSHSHHHHRTTSVSASATLQRKSTVSSSSTTPTPASQPKRSRSISDTSRLRRHSSFSHHRSKKDKEKNERWWRISDDKIKESKTADVLGMQKEVYLLFYEMERPGAADVV
ncbi:MAG: hypothetical protein M1819_003964 [Sarea resinae]|nr:MAG: hypothetical protein M1819_003964 [Sarea resinae]